MVNGACGFIERIDADEDTGEIDRIWVSFERNAGAKWRAENETTFVAITRRSATYLDMEGCKASRLQFPIVLAKATTIHKSQAATLHEGVHARQDATCKEEGQAYAALSRCPQQALCTLEYFTPKSLRFNSTAEWALTKLKAQQADRDGSQLWKQLFEPPESKEFYEARLAEMGTPNWSKMKKDTEKIQDGEELWLCPPCGQGAPNTKAGIKAHKQKCPAKLEAKAKAKAKAQMAKSKGKTKAKPSAGAKAQGAPAPTVSFHGKRPAEGCSSSAPPSKVARGQTA